MDGLMTVNETLTRREPKHELSKLLVKPIHDEFGGKLKLMFCGGAFVDRSCAEFFYRLGLPVVIGYGLTEAGTVVTINDLKPFRADSVGAPLPDLMVEIRDENEAGVGEVWVKGATVMKGYLDEPGLTAETIVDGWLRTEDLGSLDAAGHLKLVGRLKNMIVTEGGKNIYPEDIEAVFDDLDDCEEHCVLAANYVWPTGSLTDEQLLIVVRPKDDAPTTRLVEGLRTRNRKLADFKRLSGYVVWAEEFPRTASMKVKRNVLRDELAECLERDNALVEL
jgi:long-chain acyl-CoA synthetase